MNKQSKNMAKLKICDYMENKKKRKITFESLSIRDRVRKMSTKKTGQNKILKINKKQTIKLLASKRKKNYFIFIFFFIHLNLPCRFLNFHEFFQ